MAVKSPRIVGISGRAGSGKSTAALCLGDEWELVSFAEPIKRAAKLMLFNLGLSGSELDRLEQDKSFTIQPLGCTYRHFLQTLGTEWGRDLINPDIWLKMAEKTVREAEELDGKRVVFDDVRFNNEAAMIRSMGGMIIHIVRDSDDIAGSHESEAGIGFDAERDVLLRNTCSTEALRLAMRSIVR